MNEQTDLKSDLRTDPQRFEDAVRTFLAAPKKAVDAAMAADKQRKADAKRDAPKK